MKRTTLLLTVLLSAAFFAAEVSAQTISGYGVKGGLTLADLHGDDADGFDSRVGFTGGIYGLIPANPAFTLQPELLFIRKGASFEAAGDDINVSLDYIELVVLAKFTVPTQGQIVPGLYAGPYGAVAVRQEASDDDVSINVEDNFKSTDFGVALGADVGFDLSGRAATLGARYELGLTSVADADDADAKTGTFLITLGFAL